MLVFWLSFTFFHITTKHVALSRKYFFVLDGILISVSSTFQAQISGSLRPYIKNCFNYC